MNSDITILYVEDDLTNQVVIKAMLASFGYKKILVAGNSNQALTILKNPDVDIDVILMDLGLPDMDGIELTSQIRHSDFNAKNAVIIALTGSTEIKFKDKCFTTGMNAFLEKPVDKAILKSTLNKLIAERTTA